MYILYFCGCWLSSLIIISCLLRWNYLRWWRSSCRPKIKLLFQFFFIVKDKQFGRWATRVFMFTCLLVSSPCDGAEKIGHQTLNFPALRNENRNIQYIEKGGDFLTTMKQVEQTKFSHFSINFCVLCFYFLNFKIIKRSRVWNETAGSLMYRNTQQHM